MDYNFHNTIPLADAHDKHILIILVIDSQNSRKLHKWFSEFQWYENRTQKIQYTTDKKVELQQGEYFEASEFHIMIL